MFRFEDHMPEYWENESRDFQLLTRLQDLIFMGQRADIATIQNLNSSKKCKNSFLPLLAKKVGFFTDLDIEDEVLRSILSAFRLAVKHKGSKIGIFYAVTAILKAEKSVGSPEIFIDRNNDNTIEIFTPVKVVNEAALREFLKYIVPAGYAVNIYSYISNIEPKTSVLNAETAYALGKYYTSNVGRIRTQTDYSPGNMDTHLKLNYFGSMNLGSVVSLADFEKAKFDTDNNNTNEQEFETTKFT